MKNLRTKLGDFYEGFDYGFSCNILPSEVPATIKEIGRGFRDLRNLEYSEEDKAERVGILTGGILNLSIGYVLIPIGLGFIIYDLFK